jgi:antitoxin MazE
MMRTSIRKMGNSQGVLIPKPFLAQTGLDMGEVDIEIERNAIVIRKPAKKARHGWAEASKAIAAAGDDGLVWPEFGNDNDKALVW